MKFKTTVIIGILSAMLFSGCSILANAEETVNEIANNAGSMDQTVAYDEDLSDYKTLTLELDFEVSDVKLVASEDQTLHFEQKANRKELLAEMKKDKSGDHITLTFENTTKFNFNTKNSQITIAIPEEILISLDSDIDVGDLIADESPLTFDTVLIHQNVGESKLKLTKLESLLSVESLCDVGSIVIDLDGEASELYKIKAETNVGEVTLKTAGSYDKDIDITLSSNVGDVDCDLYGKFKQVTGSIHTDTGSIDYSVDKSLPAKLKLSANEFTGDIHFKTIDSFQDSDDTYYINDADKNVKSIFEIGVNIGDINISN